MENQKKYGKALPYLEKAHLINPLNDDVTIDMGSAYKQLGKTEEAFEIFEGLKEENLSDLNNSNIGAAFLESKNLKKAGEYLYPTDPPVSEAISIYNNFAIELRKKGMYKDALEHYKKCLKLEPKNNVILLNYAYVFIQMGEFETARDVLNTCLNVDPKYDNAIKLLNHISSKKTSTTPKNVTKSD